MVHGLRTDPAMITANFDGIRDCVVVTVYTKENASVAWRLHESQGMAETLVLDDGRMTDSLILAEDAIGKRLPFPSHFQRPVGEIEELDILATQTFGNIGQPSS
jgi:hypothetical protein